MRFKDIRFYEDLDYDPGYDSDFKNPTLKIHLDDYEDDDETATKAHDSAVVTVEADHIVVEPEERSGGYVQRAGYAEVDTFKVLPFSFKGKKYDASQAKEALYKLFPYFNEFEHEELESLIHAARAGVGHHHVEEDLRSWIRDQLTKKLKVKIPTKRYASS